MIFSLYKRQIGDFERLNQVISRHLKKELDLPITEEQIESLISSWANIRRNVTELKKTDPYLFPKSYVTHAEKQEEKHISAWRSFKNRYIPWL